MLSFLCWSDKEKIEDQKEHLTSCDEADIFDAVEENEKNDMGLPLHHLQTGHVFDFDNVEVLEQEGFFHRRLLLESININLQSNPCNILNGTSSMRFGPTS